MKKYILISILLFISIVQYAQVSIAPTAGVVFSTRTGNYVEFTTNSPNKFITRAMVGLSINVKMGNLISLQPEFLYIQKGMNTIDIYPFFYFYEGSQLNAGGKKEIYNYLELPLLVKFTFGNKFKYYALLGPYISYAVGGRFIKKGAGIYGNEEYSGKIVFENFSEDTWTKDQQPHPTEYYSRMDAGFYIGGGIGKKLEIGTLVFDARFGMGFIDYYKTENFEVVLEGYQPFYNRNINLSLAYFIPLGKN